MPTHHGIGPRLARTPSRHPLTRRIGALALAAGLAGLLQPAAAQERPQVYAITGATVVVAPGQVLEGATVVVRDGLIEAVGADVAAPADAWIIEGDGLTVHAGFIDAYSHIGLPQQQGGGGGGFDFSALLQPARARPGTGHPIELVHPQHRVTDELTAGEAGLENHREIGFTAALTAPRDGIFRGWGALITLGDGQPRDLVIDPRAAQHVGFDSGNFLGGYPADQLGVIATMRQVQYDVARYVEWRSRYAADPTGLRRPEYNDALAALADDAPMVFEAGSNGRIERSLRIAAEFGARPILLGSGREYEMLDLLAAQADHMSGLVVPLDLPDDPDVSGDDRLPYVSLDTLRHWEKAPGNAAALAAAGIRFALTPYGMSSVSRFHQNLRKAIEAGLSTDAALAALTTTPAEMLGVADVLGTVEEGKIANLVAVSGEPFAEETEVRHVWVDGVWFEMEAEEQVGDPDAVVDPRGEWAVTGSVMGQTQDSTWTIEGSPGNYSGSTTSQLGTMDFESVTLEGNALTVAIAVPGMGTMDLTVVIEGDEFTGSTTIDRPNGQSITMSFRGERISGPDGGVR